MKEYTTPTIAIRLEGQNVAELLAGAQRVILTVKGAGATYELTPEIEDTDLIVKLTQEQTAKLKGSVRFEATIKTSTGDVVKSETVSATIADALLDEVI